MTKKSFVYIGLIAARDAGFHLKVGKTNHPEKRAKQYATHCPGGLGSMHASCVASEAAAFAAESALIARIAVMPFARRIGPEWFWVPSDALDQAFSWMIELAGEPVSIRTN